MIIRYIKKALWCSAGASAKARTDHITLGYYADFL